MPETDEYDAALLRAAEIRISLNSARYQLNQLRLIGDPDYTNIKNSIKEAIVALTTELLRLELPLPMSIPFTP